MEFAFPRFCLGVRVNLICHALMYIGKWQISISIRMRKAAIEITDPIYN
jgi:hypothetical protein